MFLKITVVLTQIIRIHCYYNILLTYIILLYSQACQLFQTGLRLLKAKLIIRGNMLEDPENIYWNKTGLNASSDVCLVSVVIV